MYRGLFGTRGETVGNLGVPLTLVEEEEVPGPVNAIRSIEKEGSVGVIKRQYVEQILCERACQAAQARSDHVIDNCKPQGKKACSGLGGAAYGRKKHDVNRTPTSGAGTLSCLSAPEQRNKASHRRVPRFKTLFKKWTTAEKDEISTQYLKRAIENPIYVALKCGVAQTGNGTHEP